MALVSDHFQYRDPYSERNQVYEGPWQDHLRDIDPSCTLQSARGGTSWDGHAIAWWGPTLYESWGSSPDPREWVLNCGDLPNVEDLLVVTDPNSADSARWVNGYGYFNWNQQAPADWEPTDVERRQLSYSCTGFLVRHDDVRHFIEWARLVDFWDRMLPEPPTIYGMFLGEHGWALAARFFQQPGYGDDGWIQPQGCPVRLRMIAVDYLREARGFDCSVDDSYTLRLPNSELMSGLKLEWTGCGPEFRDNAGRIAVQDPTAFAEGPTALLFRQDLLEDFLTRERLNICWIVRGEKRVLSPGFGNGPYHPELRFSGAYTTAAGRPVGFVKCTFAEQDKEDRVIKVLSTDGWSP